MLPNISFFNPGCEMEIANGSAFYNLPKYPALLEHDLAVLPMYFCTNHNDIVVVDKLPDSNFIDFWKDIFPCTFITKNQINNLNQRQFNKYLPWGISPRAFNIIKPIANCFVNNIYNNFDFTNQHNLLFNR